MSEDELAAFRTLLPEDIILYGSRDFDDSLALQPERELTEPMIDKRAQEFLTGRTCARRALRALGVHDGPLLIGENRAPQWPDRVVGSISHTQGIVAAAVAAADRYRGIGIDIERRDAVAEKLERYIATPVEIERFASLPRWRTLAFSGKEALFKCVNPATGFWLEFRDVELLAVEDAHFDVRVSPKDADPFDMRGVWVETEAYVMTAVTWRSRSLHMV